MGSSCSTILYQRRAQLRDEVENAPPPLFTRVLVLANVAVFLAGLGLASQRGLPGGFYLTGGIRDRPLVNEQDRQDQFQYNRLLDDLGSLHAQDIVAGQWWRLLSCCFVHGGLLHLGMNMFALYALGQLLEQWWGRWRFLIIYLTAGLGGSCAAVLSGPLNPGPRGPGMVGASGAICGLLAAVAAWVYLNRQLLSGEFIAAWKNRLVLNAVLVVVISLMPGISMAGHLGGAAAGFVVAIPLNYQRFARGRLRWLALAAALAVPLGCGGAVAYARAATSPWKQLANQVKKQHDEEEDRLRREQEERDKQDFFERFTTRSMNADKTAVHAQVKADALLAQPPQGRSDAEREVAIKALVQAQAELDAVIQALRDAPPYTRSPQIEQRRERVRLYLRARRALVAHSEMLLDQRKPLGGDDKKTLDGLWSKTNDLRAEAYRDLRP